MAGSGKKILIFIIVLIVVIVVGFIIYRYYRDNSSSSGSSTTEGFTTNSITHIGGLEDAPMERYSSPMERYSSPMERYYGNPPSKEYFNTSAVSNVNSLNNPSYSLVSNAPEGGYYNPFLAEKYSHNEAQTIERLDRIDDKLIPTTVSNVTPYDVDVADPQFYIYQVQPPRVLKKDPQAMQADPVRGDIPIRAYPDVPIIERSQYGRDSLRLDGTFSEALNGLYSKYTGGAFFNIPQHTSLGATIAS